jgi:cyclin-dependent kinase 2
MWAVGCLFYEMDDGRILSQAKKQDDKLVLIQIFKTLGSPNEITMPGVTTNCDYLALNLPEYPVCDFKKLAPRLCPDGAQLLSSFLKVSFKLNVKDNCNRAPLAALPF